MIFLLISSALTPQVRAQATHNPHLSAHKVHHQQASYDPYADLKGIPETTRYKIWLTTKAADDMAFKKAGRNPRTEDSSNMDKSNWNKYDNLVEKYDDQIERRYHITYFQLTSIGTQAEEKHWAGSDGNG